MEISEKLKNSLNAYLQDGTLPGGFLMNVLQNNLVGAVRRADDESITQLRALVEYLYYEFPSKAWGSLKKIEEYSREMKEKLEAQRKNIAESAFASYEFDEAVIETGQWNQDGPYYSRPVHLEGENGEKRRISFGVEIQRDQENGMLEVKDVWTGDLAG